MEQTVKLLEIIGEKLLNISLGNKFFIITRKAQTTEAEINKWVHVKLKSFYTANEMIRKKRQPIECEKISANHTSDKGLIAKINKELMQLNSKNINIPI